MGRVPNRIPPPQTSHNKWLHYILGGAYSLELSCFRCVHVCLYIWSQPGSPGITIPSHHHHYPTSRESTTTTSITHPMPPLDISPAAMGERIAVMFREIETQRLVSHLLANQLFRLRPMYNGATETPRFYPPIDIHDGPIHTHCDSDCA